MAKFCGKCGSPLNENGVCLNCENTAALPALSPEEIEKQQKELKKQQEQIRKEYEKRQEKEEKKEEKKIEKKIKKAEKKAAKKAEKKAERKAKKKAKWKALTKKQKTTRIIIKLVALLLGAFIVFSLVAGVLCYFNIVNIPFVNNMLITMGIKTNPTNVSVVMEHEDHLYYCPDERLYDITDPDNVKCIEFEKSPMQITNSVSFNRESVYADGAIYSTYRDERDLYKYTIDDGDFDRDIWVSEDDIVDAGFPEYFVRGYNNPVLCGDYVYFTYIPNLEFWYEEMEDAYKLGRISLDGEIELFDDVYASTLASDGKYIYFLDNGYNYDGNHRHTIDKDRIGLYKMKSNDDPDDVELVTDNLDIESLDEHVNNQSHYSLFISMQIVDGTIYYLEDVEGTEHNILYSIDTDGNNQEIITEDSVCVYTIDAKNDMVYYLEGLSVQEDPYTMCSLSLDSGDKEELFKSKYGIVTLEVYDGYLYPQWDTYRNLPGESKQPQALGCRYNIKKDNIDILYGYYEGAMEMVADLETGMFEQQDNRGELTLYFETQDIEKDTTYPY